MRCIYRVELAKIMLSPVHPYCRALDMRTVDPRTPSSPYTLLASTGTRELARQASGRTYMQASVHRTCHVHPPASPLRGRSTLADAPTSALSLSLLVAPSLLSSMSRPTPSYSLYYVTGRPLLPSPYSSNPGHLEHLERALQGGVTVVQVREKDVDTREFWEVARGSKEVCDKVSLHRAQSGRWAAREGAASRGSKGSRGQWRRKELAVY